jgi:hypothetical protein
MQPSVQSDGQSISNISSFCQRRSLRVSGRAFSTGRMSFRSCHCGIYRSIFGMLQETDGLVIQQSGYRGGRGANRSRALGPSCTASKCRRDRILKCRLDGTCGSFGLRRAVCVAPTSLHESSSRNEVFLHRISRQAEIERHRYADQRQKKCKNNALVRSRAKSQLTSVQFVTPSVPRLVRLACHSRHSSANRYSLPHAPLNHTCST